MSALGETLRDLRLRSGLTQIGLADRTGVAVNSIRMYEAGRRIPRLEQLKALARAFGVTCSEIVRMAENQDRERNGEPVTYEKIYEKIRDNGYQALLDAVPEKLPEDYIQDENQTVVWNRQYVRDWNQKRLEILQKNRRTENDAVGLFRTDVLALLQSGHGLNEKQAGLVYDRAWEMGHAAGYYEVLQYANDLGGFARDLLDAKE